LLRSGARSALQRQRSTPRPRRQAKTASTLAAVAHCRLRTGGQRHPLFQGRRRASFASLHYNFSRQEFSNGLYDIKYRTRTDVC
jgi:hypothetical protein